MVVSMHTSKHTQFKLILLIRSHFLCVCLSYFNPFTCTLYRYRVLQRLDKNMLHFLFSKIKIKFELLYFDSKDFASLLFLVVEQNTMFIRSLLLYSPNESIFSLCLFSYFVPCSSFVLFLVGIILIFGYFFFEKRLTEL